MWERQTTPQSTGKVLGEDHDASVRMLPRDMLEDVGSQISEASNGAGALDRLAEGVQPTVVLLDQRMPQQISCLARRQGDGKRS